MTQWIVDTLIMVSALTVLVLILRRPVAALFGPTVTYWLWLLPATRVFMPPLESVVIQATPAHSYEMYQAVSNVTSQATVTSPDWPALAIIFWLGIAALIFILQTLRYIEMRDWMLSDATDLGRVEGICLIQSDRVSGPLAFGLFRRFIVVPRNFSRIFAADEREMALAHEMAHHKSGDLFANLAAFLVLCLTWFNPVSWLAWSVFRYDQEAACDARVLRGKDAKAREIYGRTLARAAYEGTPTFAMALNSPKTIISRMRKLTMKDISTYRRRLGKIGVIASTALALPLTATVVPVLAQDQETETSGAAADTAKTTIATHGTVVDVAGDGETPHIMTVKRDGRVIVLRSKTKLTQTQMDDMVNQAEIGAEIDRLSREDAKDKTKKIGNSHSVRIHFTDNGTDSTTSTEYFGGNTIPEIDISKIISIKSCRKDGLVTTNVSGPQDGQKIKVKIVMCGKNTTKLANAAAKDGLIKALSDIKTDDNLPKNIQKDVMIELEAQIKKLEQEKDTSG